MLPFRCLFASFSPNHQAEIADPVFDAPILHITNFKPNKPQTPVKLALPVTKKSPSEVTNKEELINPTIVKPNEANTEIANANEHPLRNNSETGEQLIVVTIQTVLVQQQLERPLQLQMFQTKP